MSRLTCIVALLFASTVWCSAYRACAADNLIANGNFSQWNDRNPGHWTVANNKQKVSKDTLDDRTALCVEIIKDGGRNYGEIRQTLTIHPKTDYRLTGDLKSSKGGIGFIQIKLRAGRTELERISSEWSDKGWKTVTKDFNTKGADNIQVICRYRQNAKAIGMKCWWTNVKIEQVGETAKLPKPDLNAAPAPIQLKVAEPGSNQYVTPTGAGDHSGKDWPNARAAGDGGLQSAWNAAGPGNTVYIGSGTYDNVSLTLNDGGSDAAHLKSIVGEDTGEGLPLFKSNFDKDKPEHTGGKFIVAEMNTGYWAVRNLRTEGYAIVLLCRGRHEGIRIENIDVRQSRYCFWFDGGANAAEPASGTRDVIVKDCNFHLYTKRGIRFRNGNSDMQIINCHADAGGREWATEPFAEGFHIEGSKIPGVFDHDIHFANCSSQNNWNDNGNKYWNADGYASERSSYNISFENCAAFGNTDGGWDLKSNKVTLTNCISVANKRNYRFWGDNVRLTNCLSAYSHDYGPNHHDRGIWIGKSSHVNAENLTLFSNRISMEIDTGGSLDLAQSLVITNEQKAADNLEKLAGLKTSDCIISTTTSPNAPELPAPSATWRGGDNAFDNITQPKIGYHHDPAVSVIK